MVNVTDASLPTARDLATEKNLLKRWNVGNCNKCGGLPELKEDSQDYHRTTGISIMCPICNYGKSVAVSSWGHATKDYEENKQVYKLLIQWWNNNAAIKIPTEIKCEDTTIQKAYIKMMYPHVDLDKVFA